MTGGQPREHSERRPHVWRRAFSYDQFEKIDKVARMRRELPTDVATATKFARCQIRDPGGWYRVSHSFDGIWQGEPVSFDPVIRPLFMEYAIRLYEQAARDAAERFPGFTDHLVEDGPEIGERRIVFTSPLHDLALPYMIRRMWSLHEDRVVSVAESISVQPDEPCGRIGGRRQMKLFVTLDRPSTDKSTWEEVRACFAEGKVFPIDTSSRQCDFKLAGPMRCEMSLPELAYLNWEDVRKPLSEADKMLFKAVETFNPAEISRCLALGADPNAIDHVGETPLIELASTDRWESVKPEPGESWEDLRARIPPVTFDERKACIQVLLSAGAHLDVSGPNSSTSLSRAILSKDEELLEWLLELGTDDTIMGFDDSFPGEWPTAWDRAISECSAAGGPEEREQAERTWKILRRHRQAPDGTLPHERPDW